MSASEYVHLDFDEIVAETEKAFLVKLAGDKGQHWIPRSQVADPQNYSKGEADGCISVTEWIAQQKGLI